MMDWHDRYVLQAGWTRLLRQYLFEKAGLASAQRVLEVGCGTGAVLGELRGPARLYGLDIDPDALAACALHAPRALLLRADALSLPFSAAAFDIVYCHFLLLWVHDPLQAAREMKRVARPGGYVLALAEPDYSARIDRPPSLEPLGRWQTESLQRRGADPAFGAHLADTFDQAGLHLVETGKLQPRQAQALTPREQESEWAVLESDLSGLVPPHELQRLKTLDRHAWETGARILDIPTYFAWATR